MAHSPNCAMSDARPVSTHAGTADVSDNEQASTELTSSMSPATVCAPQSFTTGVTCEQPDSPRNATSTSALAFLAASRAPLPIHFASAGQSCGPEMPTPARRATSADRAPATWTCSTVNPGGIRLRCTRYVPAIRARAASFVIQGFIGLLLVLHGFSLEPVKMTIES